MDGVQALGRLRADPATADIPVVALTAFAMKDDRERFLAAGFDGYLEKPLDVRELPRQVAATLAGVGSGGDDDDRSTATILVVDDLPQNVRLLEAMLAPRGYRVVRGELGRARRSSTSPRSRSTSCCSTS